MMQAHGSEQTGDEVGQPSGTPFGMRQVKLPQLGVVYDPLCSICDASFR